MYKLIADDLEKILNEAKSMGCNDVAAFRHIPLENVQTVVTALQKQVPMKHLLVMVTLTAALYMIPRHVLTVVKIMRSNTMSINIVLNVVRKLIGVKRL